MSYLVPQIPACTVTMSLLTLAFFGIRRLLEQKQSARWRYAVWWILGIGFLTPFKPRFGHGFLRLPFYHESYPVISTSPHGDYMFNVIDPSLKYCRVLLVIWLIGAVIAAARMISRQYHFARSVRRLGKPVGEVTQTVYQLVCMDMEIPADADVYVLPMIGTPMMTGLFRPCILLPNEDYTSEELRLIFRHELTHYLRGDLWCKLLWMCASVLHWFNPLMPKFIRQMEQDCEMACDETVLRGESEETAAAYCNTILDTAMRRCRARRQNTLLATNFSSSKENLRSRIYSILFRRNKRRFMGIAVMAAMLTLLTGSLFAYGERFDYPVPMAGEWAELTEETEPVMTDIVESFIYEDSYEVREVPDESDIIYYYEGDTAVTELTPEVFEEGIPADVMYGNNPNVIEEAWITSYEEDFMRMHDERDYAFPDAEPKVWEEASLP